MLPPKKDPPGKFGGHIQTLGAWMEGNNRLDLDRYIFLNKSSHSLRWKAKDEERANSGLFLS